MNILIARFFLFPLLFFVTVNVLTSSVYSIESETHEKTVGSNEFVQKNFSEESKWKIGGKIHFEENDSADSIGIIQINRIIKDAIHTCFSIVDDTCAPNAKALLKKEETGFVIRHYEEKSKPGIGEEMHATLLYTSKRAFNENAHETLKDIYENLIQIDDRLPRKDPPTVDQVAEAYKKIINPNEIFTISHIEFVKGTTGNAIIAKLLFQGKSEISNTYGNPVSGNFLHMTLVNVDASTLFETEKIKNIVAILQEQLAEKTIKIGNKNGQIDLEFGQSGSPQRVRPCNPHCS